MLQYYWSVTLRLFSVIYRTHAEEVLPLCRDPVDVFYSPSRPGQIMIDYILFRFYSVLYFDSGLLTVVGGYKPLRNLLVKNLSKFDPSINIKYHFFYHYYLLIWIFHSSVNWWSFTRVRVTASLLKFPGLFSVFWPFSIRLYFGWYQPILQPPSLPVSLIIL